MNKKTCLALLTAILMLISFTMIGLAESATVTTKSSPLTMRQTAGNGGKEITKIPKGETVEVLKKGDWALVSYHGKEGYVNSKYLTYAGSAGSSADSSSASSEKSLPEIRFRDLELGITAAEVFSALGDEAPWLDYGKSYSSYLPIDAAECGHAPGDNLHNEKAILIYNLNNNELAGHECWATCLYFVKPVADDRLVEDEMESIFYAGTYALDISAKDDLKAKLTELYGKPVKGKHNRKDAYTWYGKNNTAIYMTQSKQIINYLGISYAWLGFDDIFEDTCAYLDAQPSSPNDSMSGL